MRWLLSGLLIINLVQAAYIFYQSQLHPLRQNQVAEYTSQPGISEVPGQPLLPAGKEPVCDLDLVGIVSRENHNAALINYKGDHAEVIKGDHLGSHIRVEEVLDDRVVLYHRPVQQLLTLKHKVSAVDDREKQKLFSKSFPEAAPIQRVSTKNIPEKYREDINIVSDNMLSVHRRLFNKALSSGDFLKEIKFAVSSKGGFQATAVEDGSMFSGLGLQAGDIIKAVNDSELKSISDVMNIYRSMESMTTLELRLERQGQDVFYYYQLHDGR